MATIATAIGERETLADVFAHLGDMPPSRIRIRPALRTATEADVLAMHARDGR